MLNKIYSCAVVGLSSEVVEVESDVCSGLFRFSVVGLPDAAVSESRDRVFSAIKNSGFRFPRQRVTVNLAPADLKKAGPAYDLPIALSLLATTGQLTFETGRQIFLGELSLKGEVRPANGILSVAIEARRKGFLEVFVPEENAAEATLVRGLTVYPVKNLQEVKDHLEGKIKINPLPPFSFQSLKEEAPYAADFAFIQGQEHVKRALEIAASGSHNILMSGPPGSGKTLLARSLPSIFPKMTLLESLEVTRIYSVAGFLGKDKPLVTTRPFRCPHHTASGVSLVGGGAYPKPGEISLAHRGVLFLDEFPEFSRNVLENLRQPLEDGVITISRAQGSLSFPAKFTLVAAMNPCPCGYASDPERPCVCSPSELARYQKRISGPLLDRIDLHLEVPRVKYEKLSNSAKAESSAVVQARVQAARGLQEERFKQNKNEARKTRTLSNGEMKNEEIREFCVLDSASASLLKNAVESFRLSARSYYRILRLARTIADLEAQDAIKSEHIAEALQYRAKEN